MAEDEEHNSNFMYRGPWAGPLALPPETPGAVPGAQDNFVQPPRWESASKQLSNHQREKPDDEPEDNIQLMQSTGSQRSWISLEQATHWNFKLPFQHS